ncbi:hypothetical protein Q5P01_019954 [Channa striata]|uniref:Heat shock protein 70 n=1 Tax=Channa striata TaxID=64152 RepID=A0AA88M2B1_CHASR|nr:hypothetical protein Q5P01_019954 [Channa striata]
MVQEAEKYKAEDDVQRDKVSAKNGLESYAFNIKSAVEHEKLAGKISDDDKQKILDKCNEVISWFDKNQPAEKDEYEHQQQELEKVCNPIIPITVPGCWRHARWAPWSWWCSSWGRIL